MRRRTLAPWILLWGLGGCSKPFPCAPVDVHDRKHPFLVFDQHEIPALRDRVEREPYSSWMEAVRGGLQGYDDPCSACSKDPDTQEYHDSTCALYRALSWVVEQRGGALKEARDALMKAGDTSTGWKTKPGAWYWGGTLINYAYAYDFVQPALNADDDKAIRYKLTEALKKTMDEYERWYSNYTTNFRYRVGSGAATLSYALGESHHACTVERDLFGDASLRSRVALLGSYGPYMQACLTEDGTYIEGPSYQDEVFSAMLPYLQAMKRLSGGDHKGRDYVNAVNTPAAWRNDTRIARMLRYGAALSMPDGNAVTIETGWRKPLQLASIAASALSEKEGRRAVKGFYSWLSAKGKASANDPAYNILYTDPDIAEASAGVQTPTYTSVVTSDMTSLRSGWSADAIHLLMTTEHEYRPSTHSQPDQTSFLLHAKGQYLIIDPGDGRNYGPKGSPDTSPSSWINSSPESHNLVTIDSDKGLPDTHQTPAWHQLDLSSNLLRPVYDPAIIQASFVTGELDSSTVTIDGYAHAPDVSTRRTTALARRSYVVVFDHMISAPTESSRTPMSHHYDAHLHYGGWLGCRRGQHAVCTDYATSTPTAPVLSEDCGDVCGEARLVIDPAAGRLVWATQTDDGKRDLELDVVYVPRPDDFSVGHSGFTNFFQNMTFRHPFSVARYVASSTQWLTVLYPRDVTAGEQKPAIEALQVSDASGKVAPCGSAAMVSIEAQGTQDIAVVSDGAQPMEVSDPRVPPAKLQGRSALLLLRGQALERAQLDAGTSLSVGGRTLLLATAPVAASLQPEKPWPAAELVLSSATQVSLAVPRPGAQLCPDEKPWLAAELVLSSATQVSLAVPREGAQLCLDGKPARTRYDAVSRTASTSVPGGRHRLAVH